MFLEQGANLESQAAQTHPKNTHVPHPGFVPICQICIEMWPSPLDNSLMRSRFVSSR